MSSFFDSASLVQIPSGYSDGTLYSVKPIDGSGDLTFTRTNDTATRVASNGLIEKVRTNIALHSEDQTAWTDQNQTFVTANAAANPLNGAVTADKVYPSVILDDHYRGLSMGSMIGEISSSIYVKADGYSIIDYGVFNSTAANYPVRAVFDLSTETITQIDGSISSITSVGSGWYRISVTGSVASTGTMGIFHRVRSTGTSGTYAGDGTSGMLLWGCQLESGVTTDYVGPTTSAAVSVGPVANLPRLDYSGGATCPKLLLEPQRVNLAFPSESFSGYTGTAATVVSNQATSPDGYANADLMYPSTSGNFAGKYKTLAPSTTGVVSCFVKQGGKRYAILGTDNNATFTCIFDLQTATVAYEATNYTGTIEAFANGWYRVSAAYSASTAANYPFIGVADDAAGAVVVDGTNGLYIWGFQYETSASYATSYVNTLNSAVTRGAESASKTGIASLIGSTAGTIYAEIEKKEDGYWYISLSNGSANNWVFIGLDNDVLRGYVRGGAVTTVDLYSSSVPIGRYKMALAYSANDVAFYVNGSLVGSDTSATMPTGLSNFYLSAASAVGGAQAISGEIHQLLLFKTRLSNADLATLTTI